MKSTVDESPTAFEEREVLNWREEGLVIMLLGLYLRQWGGGGKTGWSRHTQRRHWG